MATTHTAIADLSAGAASIATLDWGSLAGELDTHGCAVLSGLLPDDACAALAGSYDDDARFRSRVVMSRHGLAAASTNTSRIRCPASSRRFARRSIRRSPRSRTAGTPPWRSTCG